MIENKLYLKSSVFGSGIGIVFGALIGAITGALSVSWNGVLFCAAAGGLLGVFTGAFTGSLVVRTAGHTGGVSIGAYTGMLFGAFFGGVLGIFIPASFRANVAALDILILKVLTQGWFETAVLLSFLVAILGTIVGAWVGGRNLKGRNYKQ
ncbi:MAG: hypothetical protein IPO22_15540 [Anaerolineales bacterium]|nr:hypothetical protein [Anaerolineales bacterium]